MQEQLFSAFGVDYAVLTGTLTQVRLALHPNVNYAKAAIEAYNDWLIAEWLEQDDRLLGSMMVAPQVPQHAASEIRRIGSHDQVVQVQLPGVDQSPYGHQRYWPIYEAAATEELPMGAHTATGSYGIARAPTTGAGLPLSYPERHMVTAASIMGNLASIVFEGVFVEYPNLEWVFMEGGVAWIPHFMWKMDKLWKGVGEATPWLEKPPSQYIREHIWFTTQPVEEPKDPEHLAQLFDMIHADETLLFSSDYPHWDNDNPRTLFRQIDPEVREKIFNKNASGLYNI
jgi:predicted TIM-barrel fold metal-dependent hydrolase